MSMYMSGATAVGITFEGGLVFVSEKRIAFGNFLVSKTAIVLKIISEKWNMEFPKIKNLKVHGISNDAQIIVGKGIKILKVNDEYIPFLSELQTLEKFPYIMVITQDGINESSEKITN